MMMVKESCPKCSSIMVLRTAKKGSFKGRQFYGCSRYPSCKGTRSAEELPASSYSETSAGDKSDLALVLGKKHVVPPMTKTPLSDSRKRELTKLRDRLINVASNSPSIKLNRLTKDKTFDMSLLNGFDSSLPNHVLEHCLSKNSIVNLLPSLTEQNQKLFQMLDERLTRLNRTADLIFQEKGLADLYIGFPFLSGIPAGAEKVIQAPLFLIPVRLQREKNKKGQRVWTLHRPKDEPVVFNRTLFFALQKICNLKVNESLLEEKSPDELSGNNQSFIEWGHRLLNEYGVPCGIDGQAHDTKIDPLIEFRMKEIPESYKQGLRICQFSILGIFPQSSSAIQNDYDQFLEDDEESLEDISCFFAENHDPDSELAASFENESDSKVNSEEATETVTVDHWHESNNFRLLPSDSSQDSVIMELAKPENTSLVIWGPPGTGKSNTIVNLIGDCLNRGKSVLVISQKRAALDVVYDRLSGLGLGEMVALIHDSRTDKKKLYAKLEQLTSPSLQNYSKPKLDPTDEIQAISEQLIAVSKAYNDSRYGLPLGELYKKMGAISDRVIQLDESWLKKVYSDLPTAISKVRSYQEQNKNIPSSRLLFNRKRFISLENHLRDEIKASLLNAADESIFTALAIRRTILSKTAISASDTSDTQSDYFKKFLSAFRLHQTARGIGRFFKTDFWQVRSELRRYKADSDGRVSHFSSIVAKALATIIEPKFLKQILLEIENGVFNPAELSAFGNLIGEYFYEIKSLDNMRQMMDAQLLVAVDTLQRLADDGTIDFKIDWGKIFEHSVLTTWIREIENRHSSIADIRSGRVDSLRMRYRELLEEKNKYCAFKLLEIFKNQISRPEGNNDVAKKVFAQVSKQRKSPPIRKLNDEFFKNPHYRKMTPVWLTSPEVVSEAFPYEKGIFDVVIFDEASQCTVELALPAIFRGKQVVIAGDEKQLPPFNLFKTQIDEDDADDESESLATEEPSILTLAKKVMRYKSFMLTWHYRSLFEELISFSNHAFYDGKIRTAPNVLPFTGKNAPAIKWHSVDGLWSDRANVEEAEKVVERIKEHFTQGKPPTVGVITFNINQRNLISDLLLNEEQKDPEFSDALATNRQLPIDRQLFIKNIENVQGDERQVILFSVGYAPKERGGPVFQNFGTLGQAGGENRLNVAISRAIEKIEIVSSIDPILQLNPSASKNRGPKLLREYLCFAHAVARSDFGKAMASLKSVNSNLSIQSDEYVEIVESPLEEEVLDALKRQGYKIRTQVGQSGFRIDMAIIDPDNSHKFLFGIECDGAMYHSSVSARERDVYRQKFLEGRGWIIHRIWSSNWWANKEKEIAKINRLFTEIVNRAEALTKSALKPEQNSITTDRKPVITIKRELSKTQFENGQAAVKLQEFEKPNERRKIIEDKYADPLHTIPQDQTEPAFQFSNSDYENLKRWNAQRKRMTNSYEIGLLASLNNYVYQNSNRKIIPTDLISKAKSAVKRAIELGFDRSTKY